MAVFRYTALNQAGKQISGEMEAQSRELVIRQLAEAIIKLTGSGSRIVTRPLPVDDPRVRQPDITRARALLGWEPKVPLDEGLRRTLEYFRRKLGLA